MLRWNNHKDATICVSKNCKSNNIDRNSVNVFSNASYLCDAGTSESHNDSHNIDSKLELKKFWNAVIDISAPHNCLHDAAEVIVSKNDIWRLLGHICTSYTLEEKWQAGIRQELCFNCPANVLL